MADDREPFREPRAAWKAKHHEQRLENATYTAAEVKVLTADACKFAYALGRKEAGEEIAAALDAYVANYPEDIFPPDGISRDCVAAAAMRHAYPNAARIAREIASQPSPDATSGRTDPEAQRLIDLDRVIAVKWGDKVIDPAEVIYVLREDR